MHIFIYFIKCGFAATLDLEQLETSGFFNRCNFAATDEKQKNFEIIAIFELKQIKLINPTATNRFKKN